MKISSPDIAHKTEVGGVVVGIGSEAELRREFDALIARVGRQHPAARIDGVLVAPMVSGHVEMIVGTEYDPVFGPVVMVGFGGIYAEIFRDTRLALAPVGREQAHAMLEALRGYPLLAGARGAPPRDVEALAALIVRVSDRGDRRRPHRQPRHQSRGGARGGAGMPRPRRERACLEGGNAA